MPVPMTTALGVRPRRKGFVLLQGESFCGQSCLLCNVVNVMWESLLVNHLFFLVQSSGNLIQAWDKKISFGCYCQF